MRSLKYDCGAAAEHATEATVHWARVRAFVRSCMLECRLDRRGRGRASTRVLARLHWRPSCSITLRTSASSSRQRPTRRCALCVRAGTATAPAAAARGAPQRGSSPRSTATASSRQRVRSLPKVRVRQHNTIMHAVALRQRATQRHQPISARRPRGRGRGVHRCRTVRRGALRHQHLPIQRARL
eukprot:366307-Chlamydomonas_euryale.AAC.7